MTIGEFRGRDARTGRRIRVTNEELHARSRPGSRASEQWVLRQRQRATIDFGDSDFARLQLPLRGHGATRSGGHEAIIGAGAASPTSAGRPATIDYGVGFEQLFLRVYASALERKLETLLDAPVRRQVEFELAGFTSPAMLAGLQRVVGLLVQQLDDEHSLLSPLALREM